MALHRLRGTGRRLVRPLVGPARTLGFTPDAVTLLAFAASAAAGVSFALAGPGTRYQYLTGGGLAVTGGFLDVLDGELARETGLDSRAGDFLDHTLDRYADLLVVAGLVVGTSRYALGFATVTGVLLTSTVGTECEASGLEDLLTGFLCRADRLAVVVAAAWLAAAGRPGAPVVALWLLAVGGHLTAVGRTARATRRR